MLIAEIGINHNGSMEKVKDLILTAKHAGWDAVKFQKRDIDTVYTQSFLQSKRESPWGNTQRDQKLGIELEFEQYVAIDQFCIEHDMKWGASCWDILSFNIIEALNPSFHKIASPMITYLPLLEAVAMARRKTFISTGMCSMEDIMTAVNIFKQYDCPFTLLHTVSIYPTPLEKASLNFMKKLKQTFNCDVGYSGHELGVEITKMAICMGATDIERHITLDKTSYGSDQAVSIEKDEMKEIYDWWSDFKNALGMEEKYYDPAEKIVASKLRYFQTEI